jgi:fucokinase
VVISASNAVQAEVFVQQIRRREKENALPKGVRFVVVPDLEDKRIGSGGATLNILKSLNDAFGIRDFSQLKLMVLHSGGDSRRIPQYSVCGKLFAPVPRLLSSGKHSTLFDELMMSFSAVPGRIPSGMLVMSGDSLMIFNPLQIDTQCYDAAGLSVKTDAYVGAEHGVYADEGDGLMSEFLHKLPEEILRRKGAVDASGKVNVDTGCVWLSGGVVNALWGMISEKGMLEETQFKTFVNTGTRLSFYADFVFPMAKNATLEAYLKEAPENMMNEALTHCRRMIWDALSGCQFGVIKLRPARYIHFGTTGEFLEALIYSKENYDFLGWMGKSAFVSVNSFIQDRVAISRDSYIENSVVTGDSAIGSHCFLSCVSIDNERIPDHVILHCLKLKNGKFVCRVLGINDNPKNPLSGPFLRGSVSGIMEFTGVSKKDLCETGMATLWDAKLYPECDTVGAAVQSALSLIKISEKTASEEETARWRNAQRHSLNTSFNNADASELLAWQQKTEHLVHVNAFIRQIEQGAPLDAALSALEYGGHSDIEMEMLLQKAERAEFPLNMRIYHGLSLISRRYAVECCGRNYEKLDDLAYETVKNVICPLVAKKHPFNAKGFARTLAMAELPVRVNFCGSPSDAAPYCLEHGGTMFDGALLLEGKRPIRAEVKKTDKRSIVFESLDLHERTEIQTIEEMRGCGDPEDIFALHKAVIWASGMIPISGNESLPEVLDRLGGGLYMSTLSEAPKGSGLGTSSILAAACLKAVNEIFGIPAEEDRIYAQAFAAEQFMNTGGGWQDQAGGYTPGLKLIKSRAGHYQNIEVKRAEISNEIMEALNRRFALIFSGQRRLARNVLREEMNRCIENEKTAMDAICGIRNICVLMHFELERGNVTGFAEYVTKQFELVKTVDSGASNAYIEYIFEVCADLIDGKSVCGAGGGGFLQVILKKDVTKEDLSKRIDQVFGDCGVRIWGCELI